MTTDWPITVEARASRTHGRRTLKRLLDSAVAEFGAHGYHGARMAHIARGAGVAHGTLYVYFHDKDDLLAALQEDIDADLRSALLAMPRLDRAPPAVCALREWAEQVCEVFQRHGAVLQALAEALSDDEHSRAGLAALRSMRVTTAHMARRLGDACSATVSFDPVIAALCLFALIEASNRAVYRGELEASMPELASELARFVLEVTLPTVAASR